MEPSEFSIESTYVSSQNKKVIIRSIDYASPKKINNER